MTNEPTPRQSEPAPIAPPESDRPTTSWFRDGIPAVPADLWYAVPENASFTAMRPVTPLTQVTGEAASEREQLINRPTAPRWGKKHIPVTLVLPDMAKTVFATGIDAFLNPEVRELLVIVHDTQQAYPYNHQRYIAVYGTEAALRTAYDRYVHFMATAAAEGVPPVLDLRDPMLSADFQPSQPGSGSRRVRVLDVPENPLT